MSLILKSPQEMAETIAKRTQAKRLSLNLSQQTLSHSSGVSYGTLKKFEQTGKISLESLLKIAVVLESFETFDLLFAENTTKPPTSLDDLLKENVRKRGRK